MALLPSTRTGGRESGMKAARAESTDILLGAPEKLAYKGVAMERYQAAAVLTALELDSKEKRIAADSRR